MKNKKNAKIKVNNNLRTNVKRKARKTIKPMSKKGAIILFCVSLAVLVFAFIMLVKVSQ